MREVYPKGGCGIFAICAARNISPLQVVTDGDPYGGMYTSEAMGQLGASTSFWGVTVNLRTSADLRDYFGQMMGENDVRYIDMEGVLGQDIYNMKKGMRSGHIALLVKKATNLPISTAIYLRWMKICLLLVGLRTLGQPLSLIRVALKSRIQNR